MQTKAKQQCLPGLPGFNRRLFAVCGAGSGPERERVPCHADLFSFPWCHLWAICQQEIPCVGYSPSSQPNIVRSNQSIGTFSNQLDGRTKHQHTVTQCLPNQWIGNVNCSQHGRACLHALARWSGFLQSRVFDRSPPRRGAWKVSERSSRNNIIPHLLVVILALSCCSSNLLPPSLPLAAPHPNRQAPTHHIVGIPNHSSPKGTAIRQDLPVDSLAQSHLSSLHALFLLLSTTQSANWFNRQNEHYRPPHQESLRETHHDSRLCSQHCCCVPGRLSHCFGLVHFALLARF